MRVALVNTITNIVESIIIVNSMDDIIPENYKLVEIPIVEMFSTEEERQLYEIIKEIDPTYTHSEKIEMYIKLGITKWSEARKFYEE